MSTQFRSRPLPPPIPLFRPEANFRRAFLVGITAEGAMTLVETSRASDGAAVLGLPSFETPARRADLREHAAGACRDEFGYEAGEVLQMESGAGAYGSTFLFAPLLRPAVSGSPSKSDPRVHEVFLPAVREYIRMRVREGAVVEPCVAEGLLLAEEVFPAWARLQLRAAIEALQAKSAS
jgi:hypothetical protein